MLYQALPHRADGVSALAIRGERVVAVDDVGIVRVWRFDGAFTDIDEDRLASPLTDVAWVPGQDSVVVAAPDGLHVLGLSGERLKTVAVDGAEAVAMVDADRALVAARDETVRLVALEHGRVLATAPAGERNTGIVRVPGPRPVFAVMACYQGGSMLQALTVEDGLTPVGPPLRWSTDHVSRPAFDPEGRFVAAASVRFRAFAWADDRASAETSGPATVERFWTQASYFDGAFVAGDPDGAIVRFDPSKGTKVPVATLDRAATALASDGHRLVVAGGDGLIHVWRRERKDA